MAVAPATTPSAVVAEQAREALRGLARVPLEKGAARVTVHAADESTEVMITLPREALDVLVEVLGEMANGNAVTVVPAQAELTTDQASDLLNVSRPFLIGLLDAGKIPFRMVGPHRRIRVADLMAFKQQDDAQRDAALTELTQQAQELGLGY